MIPVIGGKLLFVANNTTIEDLLSSNRYKLAQQNTEVKKRHLHILARFKVDSQTNFNMS